MSTLCKYQKDPKNVPGAYEAENYTYAPPHAYGTGWAKDGYGPLVHSELWVPEPGHPAAGR